MALSSSVRREFDQLLDRLAEHDLQEPERVRLNSLLRTEPDAKSIYCQYLQLHAMLASDAVEGPSLVLAHNPRTNADPAIFSNTRRSTETMASETVAVVREIWLTGRHWSEIVTAPLRRAQTWSIVLVALACYGTFAFLAWNLRSEKLPSVAGGDNVSVAVVSSTTDVHWSKNTSSKSAESSIRPGEPLKLDSGTIELELNAGTKLVVKGPADWSVESDNSVSLRAGKLTARVPQQAIGFTVETPTARVVDLGTEFGVAVNENGTTEVHVLKGAVLTQVTNSASRSERLEQGQAVRIERLPEQTSPTLSAIEFQDRLFVKILDSQNGAQQVRRDKTLLLEYKFNSTGITSPSTGYLNIPVQLRDATDQPADLHSKPGLGVAGDLAGHPQFGVDRAFDNTAATGMGYPNQRGGVAKHALDYNEIDSLQSWTVSGWFKTASTTPIQNGARLVNNAYGEAGFYVYGDLDENVSTMLYGGKPEPELGKVPGRNAAGQLRVHVNSDHRHTSSFSSVGYPETQKWVFFAVTYDGTTAADNLKFYKGFRNQENGGGPSQVKLIATRSLEAGRVDDERVLLSIGNWAELDRPFDGYLDNIRIDGSHLDAGGVLTLERLEARRAGDVQLTGR